MTLGSLAKIWHHIQLLNLMALPQFYSRKAHKDAMSANAQKFMTKIVILLELHFNLTWAIQDSAVKTTKCDCNSTVQIHCNVPL